MDMASGRPIKYVETGQKHKVCVWFPKSSKERKKMLKGNNFLIFDYLIRKLKKSNINKIT